MSIKDVLIITRAVTAALKNILNNTLFTIKEIIIISTMRPLKLLC